MRNWSIFRHLRTRRVAALLLAAAMMYGTLPVAYAQESTLTQQEIIAQVTSGSGVTSENDVESPEAVSSSEAASEGVAESAEAASSSEAASESVAESTETASSSEAAPESVAESAETASSSEAAPESVAESTETASSSEAAPESVAESMQVTSSNVVNDTVSVQMNQMEEGDFTFYVQNDKAYITKYNGNVTSGGKIVIPHLLGGKPVAGNYLDLPDNITNLTVEFAEGTTVVPKMMLGETVKKVILPSTVQVIETTAFLGCINLEEVSVAGAEAKPGQIILPEGLKVIERYAFKGCKKINYVKFPITLERGTQWAFADIPNLTAEFAEGTITVASYVLEGADGLKKVILPSSVQTIGTNAFIDCANLEEVSVAGAEVNPGQVILPEGLEKIGIGAFRSCEKISYVKFPTTLESVFSAFEENPNLTAEFAEGTIKVAAYVLEGATGLKKVILPSGVQEIGFSAFNGCTNLEEIEWGGVKSEPGHLIIPEGLEKIGMDAFGGCEKISYVKFPKTLEQAGEAFPMIPNLTAEFAEGTVRVRGVLNGAIGLKKVILPSSVQEIELSAFKGCTNLSQIQVGNQPVKEGQAQMPVGVVEIGWGTFEGCTSLTEFYCNGLLGSIGQNAFRGCSNLNKVVVNEMTEIEPGAFDNLNTVFYSTENSKAKEYAQQNNMGFEVLEIAPEKISFVKKQENLIMAENIPLYSEYVQPKVAVEGNPIFTTPIRFTSSSSSIYFNNNRMYVKNQAGTTTIIVQSGSSKDECTIEVSLIKSANLNASGLLLTQDQTFQLALESNPKDAIPEKEVKWTGSYVDKKGLVTVTAPFAPGSSIIVTAGFSGIQASCEVTAVEDKNVVDSVSKLESDHNYTKDGVWTYTAKGLKNLQITFDSKTNMSNGYDALSLYDGEGKRVGIYRRDELAGKTVVVPGDTVSIYLDDFNDGQQNGWGFKVTEIKEAPDQITSDEYPIDENKNISGIQPGASLESIQKDLVGQDIKVFDAKGKPVAANAPLGTGYVLTMGSFGDENQLTVVVSGDIDGDAKVAVSDTIYMKQTMMGNRVLEGAYQKAATFKSGSEEGPSVLDFTTMKQFMLGKISELK